MRSRGRFVHPVTAARRATRRRIEGQTKPGFTLIELIITIAILPIVVGGIAAALLSVFGLQGSDSNRIGDSNDVLYASTFNKDVQSSQEIETATTPACGTSGQTQILGLEWGLDANGNYDTVVSYVLTPNGQRELADPADLHVGPSTTPNSHLRSPTTRVARPWPSTRGFLGANAPWKSTQGLYGVTLTRRQSAEHGLTKDAALSVHAQRAAGREHLDRRRRL